MTTRKADQESDLLRQVQAELDDERHHPMKELGIPDYREGNAREALKRDDAWEHLRDERDSEAD
jgi:hypothetical protein